MNISPAGIGFIKAQEELELNAYQDKVGVWTIGWGHTGPDVVPDLVIDEPRAEELLAQDLAPVEKCIATFVGVDLTQGQYDALCSFIFNLGCLAFRGSTLLRKLNAGDDAGAAAEFGRWNHADGVVLSDLTKRREQEMELFLA